MANPVISKPRAVAARANLADYARTCAAFKWEDARRELDGLPGGAGLNIAHEAIDRHVAGPQGRKLAFRWLRRNGDVQDITYAELKASTGRFANALAGLGVGKGDRVFALAGRIPELYIAALGTLKNRGVFCPLFSAFGPEPIQARLSLGQAKVLVTTEALYRRKVEALRPFLPELEHVIVVGETGKPEEIPGTLDFQRLMASAGAEFEISATGEEDPALLHFTSGTTGTPKGALHVHAAVIAHHITGKWALDLKPDDVYWCTADPGWVTGASYGIIAPLTNGVTSVIDEADFDAERWYGILEEQKVSVWYTAPTAIRMMMKGGGTPLSESAFVGAGIGAALGGMRPIVEVMTVNFSLLCLDQIVNNAATLRHMSGGQLSVPLIVRMATGAGRQVAAQHSHSFEGWYAHVPGITVVAASTVADARGMLLAALKEPDPVLIFEHAALYPMEGELDEDTGHAPLRRAAVRRPGADVSLFAFGACLWKALEAAKQLSSQGVEAEVVDLRALRPLDMETILASVRKTRRAVVIDEAWRTGSLSAEISARIMEGAFYDLDAPVARVCGAEVPIPYPKHLEDAALPQPAGIVRAVMEMLPSHV